MTGTVAAGQINYSSQPGTITRQALCVTLGLFTLLGCGAGTPPYSAEQALQTFRLPQGYSIELVASEPTIGDPVAMAFDAQGRLFVLEMGDYPMQQAPQGRVIVLEDSDGQGGFKKRSVYADSLPFPTGLMPWKDGILVAVAPDIYYLPDENRDLRADEKRVVLTGFNPYNPQLRVNGLLYGIDNWIYGAYPKVGPSRRHPEQFGQPGEPLHFPDHPDVPAVDVSSLGTDFRFRLDPLKLQPVSGNSQYGNAFDAWGNRFALWNNNHIRHPVIAHRYLARNPYLSVSSAMEFPSDHENQSAVFPATESPIYIHESQVGKFTSSCGNSVYNAARFPERLRGAYFVCDPLHNLVHCDLLFPAGSTFSASRAFEQREFLTSTDAWFKPVFTTVGPDGALYVVDYYRKYIEHPDYVPEGLEGQFDLRAGAGKGRIYRVVYQGSQPTAKPDLQSAASEQLVEALTHSNMWWRITAQRLLVERQDESVVSALRDLVGTASKPESRIHALWTLDGLGQLGSDVVLQALGDENAPVREHAIRLSERVDSPPVVTKLLDLVQDPDHRVQFQLACTLGLLHESKSFRPLTQILAKHLEDRWFQIAVLTSASENASRWFQTVTRDGVFLASDSKGKHEFLGRVTAILGARQIKAEIAEVLALAARGPDGADAWWSSASLAGLGQGLKQGRAEQIRLDRSSERTLFRLIASSSAQVAAAALDLADSILLADSPTLRRLVRGAVEASSSELESTSRINAVRVMALDPTDSTIPALDHLLAPQEAAEIQIAAVEALLKNGNSRVVTLLLEKWRSYTEAVRKVVWDGLLARKAFTKTLLDGIGDETVPAWTVSRPRVNQLLQSPDDEIRRRAEILFCNLPHGRGHLIEQYQSALSVKGSIPSGKEVFRENCSRCHRLDGMGSEVGPDLMDVIGRRPKKFLLTKILDPNVNISPGYETYVIETENGATVTGVIVQDSPTSMMLRREEGEEETVLRRNIATLRVSSVSTMPEGLEEDINLSEMTDLLEYLQRLATPGPL